MLIDGYVHFFSLLTCMVLKQIESLLFESENVMKVKYDVHMLKYMLTVKYFVTRIFLCTFKL